MRTIEEAREILREGQAMLEQNIPARQGDYVRAIDALRLVLALRETARAEQMAYKLRVLEAAAKL